MATWNKTKPFELFLTPPSLINKLNLPANPQTKPSKIFSKSDRFHNFCYYFGPGHLYSSCIMATNSRLSPCFHSSLPTRLLVQQLVSHPLKMLIRSSDQNPPLGPVSLGEDKKSTWFTEAFTVSLHCITLLTLPSLCSIYISFLAVPETWQVCSCFRAL